MLQQAGEPTKINWNIINGLRGLAALYVVVNHSRGQLFTDAMDYAATVNPKSSWQWWEWVNMMLMQHTSLGQEFVILFFVLSGFSIAHSLSQNPQIGMFYVRRLIRLYPAYILGLLWAVVVFAIIRYVSPDIFYYAVETNRPIRDYYLDFISLPSIINNLLYNPGPSLLTVQYWSLPLEVIFYVLAPFIIHRFKWYGIITILLYTVGWILNGHNIKNIVTTPVPVQFLFDFGIYFWIGILIYRYKDYLLHHFRLNKILVILLLLAIFELQIILKGYIWHQEHNKILGLIMIVFSFIILLGSLKHEIRIPWLEKIGRYSYTLYVTHLASINIVNAVAYYYGYSFYTIQVLYMWYMGIAVSLICAYLLYWLAEYPSTKYLEHRRKKLNNTAA